MKNVLRRKKVPLFICENQSTHFPTNASEHIECMHFYLSHVRF